MTTQNDELDLVYNPGSQPPPRHTIVGGGMLPHRISPLPDDGMVVLDTLMEVLKVPRDITDRPRSTVTPSKYRPKYFNRNIQLSKNKLYEAIQSTIQDQGV